MACAVLPHKEEGEEGITRPKQHFFPLMTKILGSNGDQLVFAKFSNCTCHENVNIVCHQHAEIQTRSLVADIPYLTLALFKNSTFISFTRTKLA